MANIATQSINERLGTNFEIEKVAISPFGNAEFKGVKIRDHHKDTLIFVKNLSTSILNIKTLFDNQVDLGDISLDGVHFFMKTYKGENKSNISYFIKAINKNIVKDSTSKPFELKTDNIYFQDLTFRLTNENKKKPLDFSAKKTNGHLQYFSMIGEDVSLKVTELSLIDNRNIAIKNLTTDFLYSPTKMELKNAVLETENKSKIIGDLNFKYKREHFARFTDKVKINWRFKNSVISVKDLTKFHKELRGNENLFFKGNVKGTLNNLSATQLNIHSKQGMRFKGSIGLVNSFNRKRGFIFDSKIKSMSSSYTQLKNTIPNLVKKIPKRLKKIGQFSIAGRLKMTPQQVETMLTIKSEIGDVVADLELTNIDAIANVKYTGEIEFSDLSLGVITNEPLFGKVSLKSDVYGVGFNLDHINATLIGEVSKIDFKGYTYQNLQVDGQVEKRKFDGSLLANDENCKLQFEGLADFSGTTHKFDFTTVIDSLNLQKTNLFTRDSISTIKGKIKLDISGNTFDDITGKTVFKNMTYTNQKQSYIFNQVEVSSSVLDSIKTIEVTSKDIIKGKLIGKFKFSELLPVTQNAFWSMYTNYKPIDVTPNQFIGFNFKIYNQIIDIFFPQISIGSNTSIKGKINANKNAVKLTFSSPKIAIYNNIIDSIQLRVDNKNKLYNTHLTTKKIATKHYDISSLNLINRTVNDTLFFKSTFKGGKKATENFNLDFFYTINPEQESVVGIQKSNFNVKNTDWIINPENNHNNKVAFNLQEKKFNFSPFEIASGEQKINFKGFLKEKDKNLNAKFENVSLQNLLPEMEKIKLEGLLNGEIFFIEKNNHLNPSGTIKINDFIVNDFSQGTLKTKITGTSLDKYSFDFSIRDYDIDNVKARGVLDFSSGKPLINISGNFKKYELNSFSKLGGNVMKNIRGRLSGDFTAKGALSNPNLTGLLTLNDAGLTFPYLNIDFDLIRNATIQLKKQKFIFKNTILQDTKYDTKGTLSGSISHKYFKQWRLDLKLKTPNLLVLDTKEAEEIPYYGKGFIKGNATIKGLTSNLLINVNGRTKPGTVFVIPLRDVTTASNYKLIRFKTDTKKSDKKYAIEKFKGLKLKMDLDVTKDAVAQVVIDKTSGSELKGSGNGKLAIEIDTRGKFLMNGDIKIETGIYNFKYGGVITRPFKVQKGGTISWHGDPVGAELDLTAIYQTKANPAQLLDNINATRKIPIDLYVKISGGLFDSKQDFDIIIPNANSTVTSELSFKLNDNDINTKMKHFVWLMTTGTFYNEEAIGSSANAFATGTAIDVASNLLSNVLNKGNDKFRFNVGFTQADRVISENKTESYLDDVVDLSFTTKINKRVLFNGKVGVPVGSNTQTNLVGEANLEIFLNDEGSLRWTIFNKPNDIQYTLEEEGYTQGTGLSYQVNFNNLKELSEKIRGKSKKKEQKKDSIPKEKQIIRFKSKNKYIRDENK